MARKLVDIAKHYGFDGVSIVSIQISSEAYPTNCTFSISIS